MPRPITQRPITLLALLLATGLAACAQPGREARLASNSASRIASDAAGTAPPVVVQAPTDPSDPLEASNRRVLDFNLRLDDAVLRPVAVVYRDSLGNWTRTRIRNLLANLNEPTAAANSLLQGRPQEAATTALRFVFNSTAGLGGMFDLEQFGGPPRARRDFGETLHVWGLPDGPYLMVPVLGPSNPRELTGSIADGFMNPINYLIPVGANLGRGAVEGWTPGSGTSRRWTRSAPARSTSMPGSAASGSSTATPSWAAPPPARSTCWTTRAPPRDSPWIPL
ncbi:VacJ family lipoprotein [Paeniroseomonas aquatica]|uniref:MlaA family lipoprotein n=1 Tax=Paeniroseomonas aquatica TaxID=373043 RepID=UPI00360BAAD3